MATKRTFIGERTAPSLEFATFIDRLRSCEEALQEQEARLRMLEEALAEEMPLDLTDFEDDDVDLG